MAVLPAPAVLLIGTDRYAMRACERLGIEAVVIYGPSARDEGVMRLSPGMTGLFVDDQRSAETVLAALHRAGLADRRFDAVLPTNEYTLVLGGLLAGMLGCRGIAPAVAVRFRDKNLQKRHVQAAGVPAARQVLIEDIRCLDDLPALPAPRAVLKPVAGAGAKLTTVVTDAAGLRAAAAAFSARTQLRTFVLEEYIEGDEWFVDGLLAGGELAFWSVGRYGQPCLSFVSQNQPLTNLRLDPAADAGAYREAEPVVRAALTALGLRDGIFHMELFRPPGGGSLMFGECAARRGAQFIQEEVLCKFGVDLAEETLRIAVGWQPRLDVKVRPGTVGSTFLTGPPGVLISCPSAAQLLATEGVRYARVEMPVGSVIGSELGDTSSRVGMVLMSAADPGQLAARQAGVRSWFGERLVVAPPGATNAGLRSWQRLAWPDAGLDDAPPYDPQSSDEKELA